MNDEIRVPTRMGDGTFVRLTRSEIRADLIAGSEAATKRAKVPLLDDDEIDHLLEIYASPARFMGVDVGEEIEGIAYTETWHILRTDKTNFEWEGENVGREPLEDDGEAEDDGVAAAP